MTDLPDGWMLKSLSSLVREVRMSVTPEAGKRYELWSVPSFAERRPDRVDGSEIGSAKNRVQPRDVLLCKINPRINRVWIVGEEPDGFEQIASPEWLALRPLDVGPRIAPEFLHLYLASPAFRDWIAMAVSGVTGSHTRAKAGPILEQSIPVPPLDEQLRIVDILEDHLSRIDAAGQSLAAAHRRSGLLRAVTLESLAPKDAALMTLGQLATDSRYGTSTKCVVGGPGIPVVRIPNLIGGRVDLVDEKRVADATVDLTHLMLEQDDLLIVRTNGSRALIGRAAVAQSGVFASYASYLIRFRLNPSQVRPQWARVMLGTPSVRRVLEAMAASSAGQYNLGLKKLNGVTIPCPPIEDQDRLLTGFDEEEWALGLLTRNLAEGKMKAQSLRRSLLVAAFSGRLTGHSSDMEIVEEMAGV